MNEAQLEKIASGHYLVKGSLDFHSVGVLWSNNENLFNDKSDSIEIDLSQLKRSDSSGLALLMEWYREALRQNKSICFFNLPTQMYDMACLSNLDTVLPFQKSHSLNLSSL